MTANLLLTAALAAAASGRHVFPLIPYGKRPAVKNWESRATLDPSRIRRCWSTRQYNVGIACGPSGLLVVDLDTPKDSDDTPPEAWALPGIHDGHDVFAAICERHRQPLPDDTYTVRSPGGSTHLYFAALPGAGLRNTQGRDRGGLGWKIDTRAGGGLVVAAGSLTPKGPYTTVRDAPVAPLPDWLATLLTPAPLPPQKPVTVPLRSDDRRSKWLHVAINAEIQRVLTSPADGHNKALYLAAVALGQIVAGGGLTEAEVTTHLTTAAHQVGQKPGEIARTIASGLKAGARRPRTLAA
ncbi:bifunctional DNA primase/polymerase [Kitasatospora sp. NBC_00374]|uniref:bifunctional DNA primase/polymerase n=1 Tax=Kitasatospora sp. NBC_00374 TaxID=2975964 RepID=UPI0032431EDC